MNIVITGGLGFIGSHLAEKFAEENHSVTIVSLKKAIPASLQKKNITVCFGSYGEKEFMAPQVEKADIVIHAACTTVPENSTRDPFYDIQTNVLPTIRLLEICEEKKIKKFIFLSSGGVVYGKTNDNLLEEQHAQRPVSSYGISKITIEKYIYLFNHLKNLDYCILRISNAYGPGQSQAKNQGVIGAWLNNIKNNSGIEIWGDGSVIRDYIFITDIASAVANVIEKNVSGTFNIGSGKGISVNELLDIINRSLQMEIKPVYKEGRGFDVKKNILDHSKFTAATGWQPAVPIEEGIKLTWQSL